MPKALLLGAGLVARPLVHYLLDKGITLTVADQVPEKAEALIKGSPLGSACGLDAQDMAGLNQLVKAHDLTISLLPAPLHPIVAGVCLQHKKHMVTASYVSPAMRALDGPARQAQVILLNELGVDPGIDHMSAMKIIHHVKAEGGRITAFRSYCGGIPAPDSNDNPWGYKFSWSPIGVLRAATNAAHYLKNGQEIKVEARQVFMDTHALKVEGFGELEAYPNRDSLDYVEIYGLTGISTMFRGTLRFKGWSDTMRRIGELGLLSSQELTDLKQKSWPDLLAQLIGTKSTQRIKEKVANYLWLSVDSPTIRKLDWLGLFSEEKLLRERASLLELLSESMQKKMGYAPQDRDMLIMHHEFIADYGQRQERITSTLVDLGIPGGDSSMARTVSLPAAIAARLILEGAITERGVHIPVKPCFFQPIMTELATLGIAMKERIYTL